MIRARKLAILAVTMALALYAQNAGTIEGRVTNSVTGEGVGGVKVRFLDNKSYAYDTVTDANGSFRLSGLSDGDYRGTFTKDGFMDDSRNLGNPTYHVSAGVAIRADTQLKPWVRYADALSMKTGSRRRGFGWNATQSRRAAWMATRLPMPAASSCFRIWLR